MNEFFEESQTSFDLIAKDNPKLTFRVGIDEIDKLIGDKLRLGEIFEFAGTRHTSKFYLAHLLLANILVNYQDEDPLKVIIFNYANQFSTSLLVELLRKHSLDDDKINELLSIVQVKSVLHRGFLFEELKRLLQFVNEDCVWTRFRNGYNMSPTVLFIFDIGSLLFDTAYKELRGQFVQDKIFKYLEALSNSGAFILLLNHSVEKDSEHVLLPTLGVNWRRLVIHRLFLKRCQNDETLHFAFVKDLGSQKEQKVTFKLPAITRSE